MIMKWEQAVLGGRKIIILRKRTLAGNTRPMKVVIDGMVQGEILGGELKVFRVDEKPHEIYVDSMQKNITKLIGVNLEAGDSEIFCYASSEPVFKFPAVEMCDRIIEICEV